MITVENLCFDYPSKRALEGVSFQIAPHTITALVGPNGAGKTTLLRCLAALQTPTFGQITIAGFNAERKPRKIHEICSYLSDFYGLYDELTVTQHLKFFAASHKCANVDQVVNKAIQSLQLTEYKNVAAGKLSRGLKQRLAIAQTILHQPQYLFLDEPAAGLDPAARYNLSQLLLSLQKEGMTLIVSSHILAELEDYSTHMLVLEHGKMIQNTQIETTTSKTNEVTLILELTDNPTPYLSQIEAFPNLKIKEVSDKKVIVLFQGDANQQHALLKDLLAKNVPVFSMQLQKQRLQEMYLDITRSHYEKDPSREDKS